jgi:VWA domain containing CoxE-like protein
MDRGVRRVRGSGGRPGKRVSPGGGESGEAKEGAAADQAIQQANSKTKSRRELARHDQFDEVSPEVGQIDEVAFDDAMARDPDAALAMLADMTGATDEALRTLARRLAGSIMLDLGRRGRTRQRGIGKLVSQPFRPDGGDLDLDSSLGALITARATRTAVDVDELRVSGWMKPATAYCLLVDRSGSMTGTPLATSAVAAAAVAHRAEDFSVVAFAEDAVVAKSQDSDKAAERVVTDVLILRGFGTTNVALALRTAQIQLSRSRASRKITVLLSDCRSTAKGDMKTAAAGLDELVILAPEGDADDAFAFGLAVGARVVTVSGPSDIPGALAAALND